jgi:hypothetical protein
MCAIVQHARVHWKWQPLHMYVTYNHLSKVMRDLTKNDPARMVRYVRRFGHLWLAQRHPKPSLVDVVGLVAISIELWHVGQLHTSPSSLCCT